MSFNPNPGPIGNIQAATGSLFHSGSDAVNHTADQVVNGPGKFIHEAEKNIGNALGGESNAIQQGLGNIFKGGNILPMLMIGGAAILILVLLLKR